MGVPRKVVVIGLIGTQLDSGRDSARWEKWRPSVDLCRLADFEKRRGGRYHFRAPAEMAAGCAQHPEWIRATHQIAERCEGKQVLITTHSSFVLNKLGLDKLILLTPSRGLRLTDLPADTLGYFKKLSGYDTLRIVLAERVILVEGPSDELIVQRAYRDAHGGKLPLEDNVDAGTREPSEDQVEVGRLAIEAILRAEGAT